MNHTPWYVDNIAQYERDRICAELKQIRREEAAKRLQPPAERLVLRVWHLLFKQNASACRQAFQAGRTDRLRLGVTKRHGGLRR